MEQFMTSEEIAQLLHVEPVTVRRLVTKGELSAYRIGSDYRFAPSDLADYLQRQRISARAQSSSGHRLIHHPLDQLAQAFRTIMLGQQTTPVQVTSQFDLFTKQAHNVFALAQEEAQRLQHNYIGTEHLLLGLIGEGDGLASQVLSNLDVEVDPVRDAVLSTIGHGTRAVNGELVLTPRTKKVIELALEDARGLGEQLIGTEHLLLGLLREGGGIAAGVLENCGLDLQQVRAEMLQMLREQHREQEKESVVPPMPTEAKELLAEKESGHVCSFCGARCPSYFRYCFNCGRPLMRDADSHEEETER
jgi:excisionase family DNA binding protein